MKLKRSELAVPADEALTAANTDLTEARRALNKAYEREPDGAAKVAFCQLEKRVAELSDQVRDLREKLWAVKASNE